MHRDHAPAPRPPARRAGEFYAGTSAAGEELRQQLTDDIEWHVPGRNAIAGTYWGIDQMMAYFARRRELAALTFKMHPGEIFTGDGDYVASLTDGTAIIGGIERRWSTVGLYRFPEDRVTACWLPTAVRARTGQNAALGLVAAPA